MTKPTANGISSKNRVTAITAHAALLLIVFLSLLYLTLTKGWGAFIVGPFLLLAMPLVLITNIWTHLRAVRHGRDDTLIKLAIGQLASLELLYLIAPGIYDDKSIIFLGIFKMHYNDALITVSTFLTFMSLVAFFVLTIWQINILFKARRAEKNPR